MAISVLPLELSDVPASAILELEAFRSHPRIPMLWRAGYTPDLYAYYESNKRASLADPFYRMMKAVDDETGDLLAVAEWVFVFDRPAYEKEKKAFDPEAAPPENWPRDGNWALKQFFAGNLEKWEGEWLGEGAYGSKFQVSCCSQPHVWSLTRQ